MQELEKILKEIKEVLEKNKVIELNGDCTVDRCIIDVALAWDSIKAIIHNRINDGWIPVEERLPDNNENVLVTTDMGLIASGYIAHGTWITDQEPDYPIAWRPFPEPCRPERNE